jgi:adenosylhomocysteine nucleosidase
MKIGILGAVLDEVRTLKHKMVVANTTTIANREYHTGNLHGIDTTLVFSRWGKVAASSTVTSLINVFGAELIIFTGVAGAVAPELNIGDIVIGEALYQHDMDARPIFPRHQIPLTDTTLYYPEAKLLEIADAAAQKFTQKIATYISTATLAKFTISKPKVLRGIIASGDQFITNAAEHDALRLQGEKVLAVEMEGAAVAQVCHEHDIPYVIIRTISDKADHSATIDFPAFVSEVATHYADGIVEGIYSQLHRPCSL